MTHNMPSEAEYLWNIEQINENHNFHFLSLRCYVSIYTSSIWIQNRVAYCEGLTLFMYLKMDNNILKRVNKSWTTNNCIINLFSQKQSRHEA